MKMLLIALPLTDYAKALEIQERIVAEKIMASFPDVLLLLEHPPTITVGRRGSASDLLIPELELAERGIAFHTTDRGGQATYHGPGQVVCYPIMDLRSVGVSAREYVRRLEETVISTLARFGVTGFRQEGKVGIWTDPNGKIASIGVKINRRITSHGFSLNVKLEQDPCELIVTCGMPGVRQVNLNDLISGAVTVGQVMETVAECFANQFQLSLRRTPWGEASILSRE
jgi:lipoate-protein ligase B